MQRGPAVVLHWQARLWQLWKRVCVLTVGIRCQCPPSLLVEHVSVALGASRIG